MLYKSFGLSPTDQCMHIIMAQFTQSMDMLNYTDIGHQKKHLRNHLRIQTMQDFVHLLDTAWGLGCLTYPLVKKVRILRRPGTHPLLY